MTNAEDTDASPHGEPDSTPANPPTQPSRRRMPTDGTRRTRISAAWLAAGFGVLLGIALIDFLVENTRRVRIDFFSVHGQVPVAIALLAAALAGAAVVLTIGICRTTQLRLTIRHRRRNSDAS